MWIVASWMWYAAGYICRKIKEKLHRDTPHQQMINCIDSLIEGSREEYNEVPLSAEWIEIIDRGGLCHVTDITTEEANKVLQMITKLWTTITGFSFASDWVEFYKQNYTKSKPLHKGIN